VVYGQEEVVDQLIVGLLSEGHMLLEGIPGVAKTTLVKTLARLIQANFRRIQLTPDLLPSEIIGTSVYDLNSRNFNFRKGPVFTDLLLADEINRTPPKTQSALLEAMEEHQVTVDGTRYPLSPMFTVVATLNPIEMEATYPLPEAQLDRFMMKIKVSYPTPEAERQMLSDFSAGRGTRFASSGQEEGPSPLTNRDDILLCRLALRDIRVDASIVDYLMHIVQETRQHPAIELGASPRAALSLLTAARAHAAINGQAFLTPDSLKSVAMPVLRHRLILRGEALLDGLTSEDVIQQTLNRVPVPR
jgi:MoxR-like ATPase